MGEAFASAFRRYFRRPRVVLQLALLAALLSAAIIVLMAVGSAQVLASEGSEALPMVYLLLAAVSVPLASGISAALGRWSVGRISDSVSVASVLLMLVLRGALALELPGASSAVCITAYALEIVFDTLFWLSASEHLPTFELKRHTPFLAGAFGLGGIFAGFIATAFCEFFSSEDLLLLDAGLFALCVVQYRRMGHPCAAAEDDAGEADPGVIESLRGTLGLVRAFPITGAISAAVLLMSALFCLQDYLAMTVYQEAFPSADGLSSFMATVYAGHQAAELLIIAGCGRLILERAGPIVRNLIFPATTCIGLFSLLAFANLASAVFVHANVIAFSNAVFEPVKTLNFAALPYRVLAQVRMLVDGVLYPLGIALSALGLLWLQSRTSPQVVLEIAIAVALAFLVASAIVGLWFLPSLLRSLRLRAITPSEYARMDGGRVFSAGDIRHLLVHPDLEVRRFGVDLAKSLVPELLATAGAGGAAQAEASHSSWLIDQPRAEAALVAPDNGNSVQLRDEDFAAIGERRPTHERRSPSGGQGARRRRVDAKIWRLTMIARRPSAKRLDDIGQGLEDRSIAIRRATASLLSRFGAAAVPIAAVRLRSDRPEVVEAAIHVLGGIGTRPAQQLLREHLRPLYHRSQLNLDALDVLRRMDGVPDGPRLALEAWLIDSNRQIMRRALVVKSALGNARDIKLLDSLTRAREARTRSDAVEALVNLPTKRFIQPLIPLLEARSELCEAPSPDRTARLDRADAAVVLQKATTDNRWARLLVARLIEHDNSGDRAPGDEAMLDLVLFLKTTPLFRAVALEDIARIARVAEPMSGIEGEAIADANAPIRHIYVIRDGHVELLLNGKAVEIAGPGACFGESAVFGEERHAISYRTASPFVLLRFPISVVSDLVAENPDVLGQLALDLSRRLKELRAKLVRMNGDLTPEKRPPGEAA
jgi:hypothetical protein